MLKHQVIVPYEDGSFLVAYKTPGCDVMTPVCECRTQEQADDEVKRLDDEQVEREKMIRLDRELRGIGGVYPALEVL